LPGSASLNSFLPGSLDFSPQYPKIFRLLKDVVPRTDTEILTAGKDIKSEVLPFKHYV
jgi:hypothetical protein